MAYRITSATPVTAGRYLSQAQSQVENSLRAIASGSRVSRASDDPAGFAISESLRTQISSTAQAQLNADSAQGMLQTAEGGLNEQNNILIRLRELAVNAASDTIGDDERTYINDEAQQLTSEFDRIAKSTRYGGRNLLTGSGTSYEFQVGAGSGDADVIKFKADTSTTAGDVGIGGLALDDKGSARGALDDIDEAMSKVAGARAQFGATQGRLSHASDALGAQFENLSASRSRVADANVAEESARLAQAQVQQQASVAVMAQANQSSAQALRLLS